MYHPDKYILHNKALDTFCRRFNEIADKYGNIIKMAPSAKENFREDGEITFTPTNQQILYDFEKRFSYYDSFQKFQFDTFGQFERKIAKPEIRLSIQCSKQENGFIIAWHEDYLREKIEYISSKTATGIEKTGKRFTRHYLELPYTSMDIFHQILFKAFAQNQFNASSFDA